LDSGRIVNLGGKKVEREFFIKGLRGAEMLSKLRNWILLIVAVFVLLSSVGIGKSCFGCSRG